SFRVRFHTVTSCPAATRLRAIGKPMDPNPRNATFMARLYTYAPRHGPQGDPGRSAGARAGATRSRAGASAHPARRARGRQTDSLLPERHILGQAADATRAVHRDDEGVGDAVAEKLEIVQGRIRRDQQRSAIA